MPQVIDDPFGQPEEPRTFIKPNPGGRAAGGPFPSPRPPGGSAAPLDLPEEPLHDAGLNPLVALANRLLLLVPQLRATRRVEDPAALCNSLAQGVRDFETQAAMAGIARERVMAARYVLCSLLDETAADTPWGGSGVWAQQSLLALFHNERYGGEKVFQLMARLAEKPEANRDLLELIYAAISLGFEGRYRVIDNGAAQLDAVRDKLAQIVKRVRGPYAPALAQHWLGRPAQRRAAYSWLPLAACGALALLLLVGVYTGLAIWLGRLSDPVYTRIQSLRLAPPVAVAAQPAPRPRLAQFLQADIKAGLVSVRDEVDRSVVVVRGDGLFASSSDTLLPEREALMARIADALGKVPGRVIVSGHTDSKPIRSARFPSNWELSEARAASVKNLLLARKVAPERIISEGLGDTRPVARDDSPASLAMNRRVEITLMTGQRPEAAEPAAPAASVPGGR